MLPDSRELSQQDPGLFRCPFLLAWGQPAVRVARLQRELEQALEPEHAVRVIRQVQVHERRVQGEHVGQHLQARPLAPRRLDGAWRKAFKLFGVC